MNVTLRNRNYSGSGKLTRKCVETYNYNLALTFSDSGGDANSNYGNVARPYSMQPSPSHPIHGDQNGSNDENWKSHTEGRVGK